MISPFSSVWLLGSAALLCASVNLADAYESQNASPPQANAVVAEAPAGAVPTAASSGRIVRIARENDGLFYVSAKVNGVTVRFLIDTGANLVVLTPEDARRVGAGSTGASPFNHVETAAGPSRMNRITLERINVAGRTLDDIDAAVMQNGLKVSLMGQNLLSQLGPITMSADEISLQTG